MSPFLGSLTQKVVMTSGYPMVVLFSAQSHLIFTPCGGFPMVLGTKKDAFGSKKVLEASKTK